MDESGEEARYGEQGHIDVSGIRPQQSDRQSAPTLHVNLDEPTKGHDGVQDGQEPQGYDYSYPLEGTGAEQIELSYYSGTVAHPEVFYGYSPEHQERLMAQADAFTVDESRRQSRALEASINNANRGQVLSFAYNFGIPIASLLTFMLTREPLVLAGLGAPFLTVVGNIIVNVGGGKGRDE